MSHRRILIGMCQEYESGCIVLPRCPVYEDLLGIWADSLIDGRSSYDIQHASTLYIGLDTTYLMVQETDNRHVAECMEKMMNFSARVRFV